MPKFIRNYNSLAYPGGLLPPGFDPTHIAAKGMSSLHGFSAIVNASGAATDLLTGRPPSIVNTSPVVDSQLGPCFATNTNLRNGWTGNNSTTIDTEITLAVIFKLTGVLNNGGLLTTGTSTFGAGLVLNSTSLVSFTLNDGTLVNQFGLTGINITNRPVFYAASYSKLAGVCNHVVTLLDNGQIFSIKNTAGGGAGTASDGTYELNFCPGNNCMGPGLSASGMFAPSFMKLTTMLEWAAEPWSFWYPSTQRSLMFSGVHGTFSSSTFPYPPFQLKAA